MRSRHRKSVIKAFCRRGGYYRGEPGLSRHFTNEKRYRHHYGSDSSPAMKYSHRGDTNHLKRGYASIKSEIPSERAFCVCACALAWRNTEANTWHLLCISTSGSEVAYIHHLYHGISISKNLHHFSLERIKSGEITSTESIWEVRPEMVIEIEK